MRWAICSLVNPISEFFNGMIRQLATFSYCSLLYSLFIILALGDAMYIDAGSMNVVGIKLAIRNEFFHLRNCNLTRHCHQWIEIPRRFLVHEISHRITL